MKKLYKNVRLAEEEFLLKFFENCFNLQVINKLLKFKEEEEPNNYLPFFMRGYSLPIYEAFGGKVHDICRAASRSLGFKDKEIEFYVSNDSEFNSSSILSPIEGKPHVVIINRGLLEKVDSDELAFIMGHEIGHLIYNHAYVTQVIQYVFPDYDHLPPLLQKTYDLWSKLCEISSDRIGLMATGDLEVSIRALFKLSSGLDQRFFNLSFDNILEISEKIYTEMRDHPSYILASHPGNPIRIKALVEFHKSGLWKSIQDGKPIEEDKALNAKIAELLVMMKKSPLGGQEETELLFLATAGMALMVADREVDQGEYEYLLNVLAQYIHWPPAYLEQLDKKKVFEIMQKSAKKILKDYPHKTRELARKLFPICVRDKQFGAKEVDTFIRIAHEELCIPISEVVDLILEGIQTLFKPFC